MGNGKMKPIYAWALQYREDEMIYIIRFIQEFKMQHQGDLSYVFL